MAEEREVFQRQPARAVLIDFTPPITLDTLTNIQQSLSNTLSLLTHLSGGHVRVPYISLIVLGNYPEAEKCRVIFNVDLPSANDDLTFTARRYMSHKAIYPLQPLKGNTTRLTSAIKELGSLARNMVARQRPTRGCLLEGLQEALAQFNRLSQTYRQGPGSANLPSQIEITLLTAMSPLKMSSMVGRTTDHLDLQHLKIINGVCVSDPDRLVMSDGPGSVEEGGLDHHSPPDLGLSMLEVVSIDNDVLNLQSVFQGWLRDCSTDSEHLHLSLPPTLQGLTGSDGLSSQLSLKCDLHERLLDPLLLGGGIGQKFALNGPIGHRGSGNSSLSVPSLPVHKLRATALVSAEGVCESVLFGLPQVLKPTACWKLDWEDLETNQQLFCALCQHLRDKNQMLVAKADISSSLLSPHFLILPSTSQSLLIKSLAVNELVLPVEPPTAVELPSNAVQQFVTNALDQLETYDTYNPLMSPCGLYESLTQSKRGPGVAQRGPGGVVQRAPPNPPSRARNSTLGTRRSYSNKKGLGF